MNDKNRSVSTYKSPAQPLPNKSAKMLPLLYHAHHNRYKEDLPFWLELAARHGDPVLELGCGSGRVLLALAQDGYQVYGLDNDPGMLFHSDSMASTARAVGPFREKPRQSRA